MARGWSRSLFLVLLSYACKEALKIDWKLEEEEEKDAIGKTWDGCHGAVVEAAGAKELIGAENCLLHSSIYIACTTDPAHLCMLMNPIFSLHASRIASSVPFQEFVKRNEK